MSVFSVVFVVFSLQALGGEDEIGGSPSPWWLNQGFSFLVALFSGVAATLTMVLASKADRRAAIEPKLVLLRRQIAELEMKLASAPPPFAPPSREITYTPKKALARFAESRLRLAIGMSVFSVVFALCSLVCWTLVALNFGALGGGEPPPWWRNPEFLIPSSVAIIAAVGTVSTMVLGWRADRRAANESELKLLQLRQQIAELEMKLSQGALPRSSV